jgi:type IV pilus assembly protein PilO
MSQARKEGFAQLIEDFSCLSNKDPGTWLPIPRFCVLVVITIAVVAVGWLFFWQSQWEEIDREVARESQLKNEWLEAKKASASLELYRQQLEEIDRAFGALLKQLPSKAEVESLLVEVNQAGLGRGLQFELFKLDAEQKKDFYAELPVSVKVSGSYNDMGTFAADISRLPRVVTLNDIDLARAPATGQMNMSMKLKTFRYLEDDEVQAQKPQGRKK